MLRKIKRASHLWTTAGYEADSISIEPGEIILALRSVRNAPRFPWSDVQVVLHRNIVCWSPNIDMTSYEEVV